MEVIVIGIGIIIIIMIGLGIIIQNQCEIGDKLDEANDLSEQRNEILRKK